MWAPFSSDFHPKSLKGNESYESHKAIVTHVSEKWPTAKNECVDPIFIQKVSDYWVFLSKTINKCIWLNRQRILKVSILLKEWALQSIVRKKGEESFWKNAILGENQTQVLSHHSRTCYQCATPHLL